MAMNPKRQGPLNAEYYGQGIAVFGDTMTWKENIKQLGGGSFNKNLNGSPGWIFPKTAEPVVMQFIANANAGLVQPIPDPKRVAPQFQQVPQQFAQPQMVPFGQVQPVMSPQAAMTRLMVAQPQVPQPGFTVPTPTLNRVGIPVPAPSPRQLVPAPVTAAPATPTAVTFPNIFMAADGLTYQIVMYTVPLPSLNQRCVVKVGEAEINYTVVTITTPGAPVDSVFITQDLTPEAEAGTEPPMSRAVLSAGKWQIHGMQDEHSVTFLPLPPKQ